MDIQQKQNLQKHQLAVISSSAKTWLQSWMPQVNKTVRLASGFGKVIAGIGSMIAGHEIYTDDDIVDQTIKTLGTMGHSSEGVLMLISGISELISIMPNNEVAQETLQKISSFIQATASLGTTFASVGAFRDGDNVSGCLHALQAMSNLGTALSSSINCIKKRKTCKYSLSTASNVVDTIASLVVGIYANANGHIVESVGNFIQTISSFSEIAHHKYTKKRIKERNQNTIVEQCHVEQPVESSFLSHPEPSNRFLVMLPVDNHERYIQ